MIKKGLKDEKYHATDGAGSNIDDS